MKYNHVMDFQEHRRRIFVTVALTATVPVLAMLCRGHTPSRFDVPNLPAWERTALPAAAPAVRPAETPLAPNDLFVDNCPPIRDLLATSDEQLFQHLEQPAATTQGRDKAGAPGEWLEQAALFAANHAQLSQRVTAVAMRLLNDQTPEGYLGPDKTIHRFTTAEIAAHARNTAGLLAAYPIIDNPAIQYSAIRAGHFIMENYDAAYAGKSAIDKDAIIYALARLYLSTSDRDYLNAACRDEVAGETSGVTLCTLYQATGNGAYLARAKTRWIRGDHSPRLAAALFSLTGAPGYLENCRDADPSEVTATRIGFESNTRVAGDRSPWLYPVAVTRSRAGISVNRLLPVKATAGKFILAIQPAADESTIVVAKAPQTSAEIRTLPLYQPEHASGTGVKSVTVHSPLSQPARAWTKLRRWQSGDKIVVTRTPKFGSGPVTLKPSENNKASSPPAPTGANHTGHEAKRSTNAPVAAEPDHS